jgi:hypothetical protein
LKENPVVGCGGVVQAVQAVDGVDRSAAVCRKIDHNVVGGERVDLEFVNKYIAVGGAIKGDLTIGRETKGRRKILYWMEAT